MDGIFMKTQDKIFISVIAGLVAVSLQVCPMWWGTLFAPITEQLATEPVTEVLTQGFCWQSEGLIFRLRGLDLLMEFFGRFR